MTARAAHQGFGVLVTLGATLCAFAASAQSKLVFINEAQLLRAGRPSGGFFVQRQSSNGSPLSTGQSALTVTLGSSSPLGQFSLSPSYGSSWASTLDVVIAPNESTSGAFFYRDPIVGTPTLSGVASGFITASQGQRVLPLAFVSEFETSTLDESDTPAGVWGDVQISRSGNAVETSTAAAHRGHRGLRVTDAISSVGSGPEALLAYHTAPFQGSLYVRTWLRVASSNDLGDLVILQLVTGPTRTAVDLRLRTPGPELVVAGHPGLTGTYSSRPLGITLDAGIWRLVEVELTGCGTANGARRTWVDGVLKDSASGMDFTGFLPNFANLGIPFSDDQRFAGALDFDDYRLSTTPPATRLRLVLDGSQVTVGECHRLSVSLESAASGGEVDAPYAVIVALGGDPGVELFSNASCTVSSARAVISEGTRTGNAFFRATKAQSHQLSAVHPDFLSASLQLPEPTASVGGCACRSSRGPMDSVGLLSVLALFSAARRLASRRSR